MSYTERFTSKAETYNKYRPKYPEELLGILQNELKLTPEKLVADIGSGTGISCEPFLDNGNMAFAVEPNAEMREMAERNFELEENFVSVDGTAESTGLHDKSIDLIFSGTAFHWFDMKNSKKEFERILKPNGNIMIAWISRDMEDALQVETEQIFNRYTEEIEATEKQKEGFTVKEFFAPKELNHRTVEHSQNFGLEEFLGRLRSSSYFPEEGSENFEEMTADFTKVFEKFENEEGRVDFKYKTEIYWV